MSDRSLFKPWILLFICLCLSPCCLNSAIILMFANKAKLFYCSHQFALLSKLLLLVSVSSLKKLIGLWTERYPDPKVDPLNLWDNIITSRSVSFKIFFSHIFS